VENRSKRKTPEAVADKWQYDLIDLESRATAETDEDLTLGNFRNCRSRGVVLTSVRVNKGTIKFGVENLDRRDM
jgi:hypothetical protein